MDKLIAIHFSNPLASIPAFNSIQGLQQFYGSDATLADIRQGLSRVQGYALKSRPRLIRPRNPYYVFKRLDLVEGDLAFMTERALVRANDGIQYLLVCINAFSRRLYVYPLKNKLAPSVLTGLRAILRDIGPGLKTFRSDRGTEFLDRRVQTFFNYHNIDHRVPRASEHCSLVERVIGTLKRKIYAFLADQDSLRYIDDLDQLVHNYNSRRHSTIKMSPMQQIYLRTRTLY